MFDIPESDITRIALQRHYTVALDQAGLLVAMSRCRITDREPIFALRARQQSQYIDLIHEFCYNARKAIELADHARPGVLSHAKTVQLRGLGDDVKPGEFDANVPPLADESLWWVLGRVIHSHELYVVERVNHEVGTKWARAPHITGYWAPAGFAVRSDHDAAEVKHLVLTERLVEAFLALGASFAAALKTARSSTGC